MPLLLFISFLRNLYNISHCKSNVDAKTHSCFWKLGTCIRVPTVVWTEIDGASKIGSEQK